MAMSRGFGWILLASGLLKIGLALAFADLDHQYDGRQFLENARAVYEGLAPPLAFRAPGYQGFLVASLHLSGGHTVGIYALQALISTFACFLVYRIGRRWSERAGFWAGAFVAFHPTQVAFAHWPWAETLYGALVLLALDRLWVADARESRGAALVAGVALGLASLTRSIGLVLLAASALWLWLPRRHARGLMLSAALVLPALAVIAPWSLTVSQRAGCLVLVDTNGGYNLWSGNNAYIPDDLQGIWALGIPLHNDLDARLARPRPDDGWRKEVLLQMGRDGLGVADRLGCRGSAWYRNQAVDEIRRDPGAALARVPLKLAALWAPDFFLARHLLRDWYGPTPPALAALLVGLTWAWAAVALLAGPLALAALAPQRFRSLALGWVAVYIAAHAVFFGASRMHFPLVPVLALALAGFLFDPDHPPDPRRALRRGGAWAGLALFAWLLGSASMAGLYVSPGPRHLGMARVLGAARHLPVPAARRAAWMLAELEASNGHAERADAILAEPRVADDPWSLYLRGRIERDPELAQRWFDRALETDPLLFAAWAASGELCLDRGDFAAAAAAFARAASLRPWDAEVRSDLERVRGLERRSDRIRNGSR